MYSHPLRYVCIRYIVLARKDKGSWVPIATDIESKDSAQLALDNYLADHPRYRSSRYEFEIRPV